MYGRTEFERHPSVVFTQLDEAESILLHLDTKRYYSLNETASRLWSLLEEASRARELSECLCREYAVDPREATACVTDFLRDLQGEGLLREKVT